jgi:hypothetical protein
MTINTAYQFYSDPGHGWMAVSFKNFFAVGAKLEDVSNFSYVRGKTLYLEEDGDAGEELDLTPKTKEAAMAEHLAKKYGDKPTSPFNR